MVIFVAIVFFFFELQRVFLFLEKIKKMKPISESSRLAEASRDSVNKLLDRSNARGSRGKKKRDDSAAQNSDSAKVGFSTLMLCGFPLSLLRCFCLSYA